MGYGQNSVVGVAFQNSFDSAASVSSLFYIKHVGESVGLEIPELIGETKTGTFDESDSLGGARMVSGELNIEPHPIDLGMVMKGMFGAPTTTTSGSLYTHVYELATTDWDSLSAKPPMTYYKELATTGSTFLYHNMNISEMSFEVAAGELMKSKVVFAGGEDALTAAQTQSYHTQGNQWTWDQASLSLGGSGTTDIEQLSITVNDNITAKHAINNSQYPQRIKRDGASVVSISGTMRFEDQAEYLEFKNQTYRELDITFTGATDVQSGYPELVRFQVPRLKYTEFKPAVEGEGELTVSFSGKGKYSTSSATAIRVTLMNGHDAY